MVVRRWSAHYQVMHGTQVYLLACAYRMTEEFSEVACHQRQPFRELDEEGQSFIQRNLPENCEKTDNLLLWESDFCDWKGIGISLSLSLSLTSLAPLHLCCASIISSPHVITLKNNHFICQNPKLPLRLSFSKTTHVSPDLTSLKPEALPKIANGSKRERERAGVEEDRFTMSDAMP